jgi:hypothetical protein
LRAERLVFAKIVNLDEGRSIFFNDFEGPVRDILVKEVE